MTVRLVIQPPQVKNRTFRAAADPLQGWSDEELRKRYRFGRRGLNLFTEVRKRSPEANEKKLCNVSNTPNTDSFTVL